MYKGRIMNSNIRELITTNKYKLNELEYGVLNYIVENFSEFKEMTIDELSKNTFCSKSTIFRLTQKLGFSGYSEFKTLVKIENKDIIFDKSNEIFINNTKNSELLHKVKMSNLEMLVKELNTNTKMLVIASGYSNIIKDYLQHSLYIKGKNIIASNIDDPGSVFYEQVKQSDLIICISNSAISNSFSNKLQVAKLQKKNYIVLTANDKAKLENCIYIPVLSENKPTYFIQNCISIIDYVIAEMK